MLTNGAPLDTRHCCRICLRKMGARGLDNYARDR